MLLRRPYLYDHSCKHGQEWDSAASTAQHSTTQHSTARANVSLCLCQDVDMTICDSVTTASGELHKQNVPSAEKTRGYHVSQARCRVFWSLVLLNQ